MASGDLKKRRRIQWQPAVPRVISGAECCPAAIDEYVDALRSEKKPSDAIILNVRKHLLYSGWKIDFSGGGDVIKLRYSSPDGRSFYSLPQVCASFSHGCQAMESTPPVPKRLKIAVAPSEKPVSSPLSEKSGVSYDKKTSFFNPNEAVIIEPKFCPESVSDYCLRSSEHGWKPGAMKAKQHLSAIGWSFYYTLKGGNKRELRYTSPNGRVFHSLLTACKWSLCADAPTCSDVIDKIGRAHENFMVPLEKHTLTNCESLPILLNESTGIVKKRGQEFSMRGRKFESCPTSKRVRDLVPSPCHRNPRSLLSWLIDSGVVFPSARVEYHGKNGLAMAEGQISRKGIKCSCCGLLFTLTKFEAHAGSTNHRPSANIFLDDGRSLMDCQRELKQRKDNACSTASRSSITKGRGSTFGVMTSGGWTNDEVCSVCHDGGKLVLCDGCPSSFHMDCLGLKEVPDGDWFCPYCCCRICGLGRFKGEIEQDIDHSVLTCSQCEVQYHKECLRYEGTTSCYSGTSWFCEDTCEKIFSCLHEILGKPVHVGTGDLTWTLLKYIKSDPHDPYPIYDEEGSLEVYGKLNVALGVMHECFEPVKESGTGSDLLENVIFSKRSGLSRNNYRGFYTVVLEKNDELIAAATVRIYGKRVAEVPLVATRFLYRRLGMCRILIDELEKKLAELGVERLVLPAVPTLLSTWINSFGFSVMNETDRLKFLGFNFLDFQGTVMCQKILTDSPSSVSSQSTGTEVKSCYHANGVVDFELEGKSLVSEVRCGEELIEETDFIELDSTWWIDELLLSG